MHMCWNNFLFCLKGNGYYRLVGVHHGSPFEMINVTITITDPFGSHLLPCSLMLLYIKTWRKQRPKHPACCVAAVLVCELQVLVPAHMLAELAQLHGIHPILCNTLLCSHVRERCWRLTVQGIDLAWFSFIASCGLGIDFNWNRSQVLQLWTIVLTVLYEVCLRPAWGLSPEWKKMEKVESLQVCIRVKRLSFLSPRIKTDNHYQILDWFNLEGWYERRTGIHGVTESFAIIMPYHDWTSLSLWIKHRHEILWGWSPGGHTEPQKWAWTSSN